MANFEVLSLDPTTPQIRAPGAGDGYSVPRDMTVASGANLTLSGGTANGVLYLNGSKVATSGTALTFDGDALTIGSATAPRLRANMSGAQATRFAIQNSTANGNSRIHVYPNGTGNISAITFRNNSDPDAVNFNGFDIACVSTTDCRITSQAGGSNSQLPLTFYIGSSEVARFDTSGNLGIGTTSPTYKLDVSVTTNNGIRTTSSAGQQSYLGNTGGEAVTGTLNNYGFGIVTNGSIRGYFDTSGNLGLGVTPSAWDSSLRFLEMPYGVGYGANTGIASVYVVSNAFYSSGSWKYKTSDEATYYQQINGQHLWYNAPSGTAGNAITFTQAMTLDASGNLGIGTTSPGMRLDVAGGTGRIIPSGGSANSPESGAGTWNVYGANSGPTDRTGALRIECYSDQNTDVGTGIAFSNRYISSNVASWTMAKIGAYKRVSTSGGAGGYLTFSTTTDGGALTERARITSDGDLCVGKTGVDPTVGLGMYTQPNGVLSLVRQGSTSGTQTLFVYSLDAAAYRFYVGMNGTISATNTTISAISDQRYKENIRDLDVGLDAILALKPRKFDWKEGKGKDIKDDRGFIAQEFEQVFPDLVDEWKDPAPEGEEPYKSVRQDLIPVLVKAMQEQQAMIEELKAKVAALEAR